MISVIIACLNGEDTLLPALESLAAQDYAGPWEIVLADNGSTDASRAVFESFARGNPQVPARLVDAAGRRGKSHALNLGIRAASGDRLVFLDADDTVEPGWLSAMAAALDRHDFVAARTDVARLNPAWVTAVRRHPQQTRLLKLKHAPFCDYAGGATLGMHRRVFDAVGGFDPDTLCLEDNDFCIRAHLKGFRLRFAPQAVYNYRFRTEPKAIYRQSYAYARARALLRSRYAGSRPMLSPLPWLSLGGAFALLALDFGAGVLRGPLSPEDAARFSDALGSLRGDLSGALALRSAPANRGFGGLRGRLAKAKRAIMCRALAPWYGSTVCVRTREKLIALTFDDGPDPEWTPALLDALARLGAKATFFVVGERAERHPELVARIAAEGHEIGNHSWDHPSLPTLTAAQVEAQLARTRRALAPHGQALMRPPFGDQNAASHRAARRLGYRVVLWSVSGEDWEGRDADSLAERILAQAAPGAIVLLHDSLYAYEDESRRDRRPTIEAVTRVVERLPDYRFVTVSELRARGRAVERARMKASPAAYLEGLRSVAPGGFPDAHAG